MFYVILSESCEDDVREGIKKQSMLAYLLACVVLGGIDNNVERSVYLIVQDYHT